MLDTCTAGARRRSAFATLLQTMAAAGQAMLHRHRVRRTIAHLDGLDDRMLKDLGLSRSDLHSAAIHGRMPGEGR